MELPELLAEHGDLSRHPPERRILIAALDCIRQSGLQRVTVRAIAARARVNPAAINYYYRSKNRAIEEALRAAWSHVADDIDLIMKEAADGAAAARLAVRYLMEGSRGSPKVIHAIVVEHPALRVEAARFFRALFAKIEKRGGGQTGRLTALLLISMSVFLAVAPDAAAALCGVDLADADARMRLWTRVSDSLFSSAARGPSHRPARRTGLPRSPAHQKASPRLK